MKKKCWRYIICYIFIFVSIAGPFAQDAEAFWFYFIFDVKRCQRVIKQIEDFKKELSYMKEELKHLEGMDGDISSVTQAYVQEKLQRLITIRNTVKGITYNYSLIQKEWDNTFKDFAAFNGMKASAYADYLKALDEKTSNALFDAMKAQGLIAEHDGDKIVLGKLMEASKGSKGILSAIQVANCFSALQLTQLMRMELIMTMSFRAETTYYQWLIQEKISQRAYAKKNQIEFDNPTGSVSTNGAFPQF